MPYASGHLQRTPAREQWHAMTHLFFRGRAPRCNWVTTEGTWPISSVALCLLPIETQATVHLATTAERQRHTLLALTLEKLLSCHKIVAFRPCIDDGRVGPLSKALSNTSQRFSVRLRSGQSMCEIDIPCTLNHSVIIWAWWILALSVFGYDHQGRKYPLME